MAAIKLTEAVVKGLLLPATGQKLVYDSALTGFGIRLSRTTKSFFAERRLNGKTKRITVGPYPHLSVEVARKLAHPILSDLVQGIDRKALQERAKLKAVTLEEAFKQFTQAKKSLAQRTLDDYDDLLRRLVADWWGRPWVEVSPSMVLKRHGEIGQNNGRTTANHAMAAFGTVFRFAMKYYRDEAGKMLVSECPTSILSDADAWFPQKPKEAYIKPAQLPAWWSSVQSIENGSVRDLLVLYILTGLRPAEGRSLKWADVDLAQRTISLSKTKNKKKHVIPIGAYLLDVLVKRKEAATSDFVFPGEGKLGHIVDLRKNLAKVTKQSGVHFTPHDLRRSFSNYLEMVDVTFYAHKRLLNHTVARDVTATHYLSLDVERLREPMEKVNRFVLRHAGVMPTAEIVQIHPSSTPVAA